MSLSDLAAYNKAGFAMGGISWGLTKMYTESMTVKGLLTHPTPRHHEAECSFYVELKSMEKRKNLYEESQEHD